MPDVIYDRATAFSKKQKPLVRFIRQQFRQHPSIHFINQVDTIGKWDLYKELSNDTHIKRHLPHTVISRSIKDIKQMVSNHSFVFIKSNYGSGSREVMSIEKIKAGYIVNYYERGLKREVINQWSKVDELIKTFMGNKQFLIQEGVKSLGYKGKTFDTRVLVQKDHWGNWQVTYNYVRVASENYSITTIDRDVHDYQDIYAAVHEENPLIPTDKEVRDIAIKIVKAIEEKYGSLGEIGLDIAIDQLGYIYLLEANSKPEKFSSPGQTKSDEVLPQYLYILEYAKFIAKQECSHKVVPNDNNNFSKNNLFLGTFISIGNLKRLLDQEPKFRHLELMKANQEANTNLYFFSIRDIHFLNQKINGTYFNQETGLWEQKNFPFPDVFYDRGGAVLEHQKVVSDYIREQLELLPSLKKVNPVYTFDKWDLYRKLYQYDEVRQYLPLTKLYKKTSDLKDMFHETNTLYLKKCDGNNGETIIKVVYDQDDQYTISYLKGSQLTQKTVHLFENLIKEIRFLLCKNDVIIQSAINVLEINNCNVDMRATLQRNGHGELEIVAYPVRKGVPNYPITSTRTGATVYRFDDFFTKYMSYSSKDIEHLKQKVETFLINCYHCVEESYGQFGELGIDFAIDRYENLWFIECNAKPGNDSLYMSYDESTIKKGFTNPLEYAKFIHSKGINKNE
nr:YheC/YheD family protein [Texcoconibacillus texcoconensis]